MTLPPPYRNLKDVSAHQRPQQRPVSLDHGTGGELQYAKVYLEAAASLSSSILEEAEYLLSHPRTMRSYRSRSVERIAELARGIQVVAKIGVEGPVKAKEQAND